MTRKISIFHISFHLYNINKVFLLKLNLKSFSHQKIFQLVKLVVPLWYIIDFRVMIRPTIMEKQCRVNNSCRVSFHCQSHEEIYFYSWMKNSTLIPFTFPLMTDCFPFHGVGMNFFFLFPRRLINTMNYLDQKSIPPLQTRLSIFIFRVGSSGARLQCKLLHMINQVDRYRAIWGLFLDKDVMK